MFLNRAVVRKYENPIMLSNVPARHVITAASSAAENAAMYYYPDISPQARESIEIGSTVVHWQNKPSQNNQSNLFIAGLGKYGYFNSKGKYDSNAILSLIDIITDDWVTEEKLAECMIRYSKTGMPLSLKDLGMSSTNKNKSLIDNSLSHVMCRNMEIYIYQPS